MNSLRTPHSGDSDELDAAIRIVLADIVALAPTAEAAVTVAPAIRSSDVRRRMIPFAAVAAAVALVVGGLVVIGQRSEPADTGVAGPVPSAPPVVPTAGGTTVPDPSTAPNDQGPVVAPTDAVDLAAPTSTVMGALVDPLLPDGFELVVAVDTPEAFAVALNAVGDRFEARILSGPSVFREIELRRGGEYVDVDEGRLAVGPNGLPDPLGAYLVTDRALITTAFVRLGDLSSVDGSAAVDIARSIAAGLPDDLVSGVDSEDPSTPLLDQVSTAIAGLAESVDQIGSSLKVPTEFTVRVVGSFVSVAGGSAEAVQVEAFAGFTAPSFLDPEDRSDARRRAARFDEWLVIVTVEGDSVPVELVPTVIEVVGAVLVRPAGSADVGEPDVDVRPGSVPVDGVVEAGQRDCIHAVGVGDSVGSIALRFGVTVDDLAAVNSNLDALQVGSVVQIPCEGGLPSLAAERLEDGSFVVPEAMPASDIGSTITVGTELFAFVISSATVGDRDAIVVEQFDRSTGASLVSAEIGEIVGCEGSVSVASSFESGDQVDAFPVDCEATGAEGTLDVFSGRVIFPNGTRLLIANATITGGVAGALSGALDDEYAVLDPVNASGPNISESVIYYGPGRQASAASLATLLSIANVEPMQDPLPIESTSPLDSDDVDVLIVLGDDWTP